MLYNAAAPPSGWGRCSGRRPVSSPALTRGGDAITPGTRLGPFETVFPLDAGGMGDVLRARETRSQREVAINVLPGALSADTERLARFDREARRLESMNHPRIGGLPGIEDAEGHRGSARSPMS